MDPPKRRGRAFDPWRDLEWEEHPEAQEIVAAHPDGMTLEQVGQILGVTRERVRQIEAEAMQKLKTGIDTAHIVTLEDADRTVAVLMCDHCGEYFPREGRRKLCATCAEIPAATRRRIEHERIFGPEVVKLEEAARIEKRREAVRRSRQKRRAARMPMGKVLPLPLPNPEPTPEHYGAVSMTFDLCL